MWRRPVRAFVIQLAAVRAPDRAGAPGPRDLEPVARPVERLHEYFQPARKTQRIREPAAIRRHPRLRRGKLTLNKRTSLTRNADTLDPDLKWAGQREREGGSENGYSVNLDPSNVSYRRELLAHIQNTRAQYNLPAFERRLAYPANRDGVSARFDDPSVRKSIDVDLALIDQYDTLIVDLDLTIVREAKRHDANAFHRLRTVPGIGKVLALTILYEIHDVTRFDRVQEFASDARLVKCVKTSAGKKLGTGGAKMGNVHLKWAFSEAAVLFLRHTSDGKKLLARIEKKHGKGKALSILAHKIGRAVFYMLSRGTVFSMEKFLAA